MNRMLVAAAVGISLAGMATAEAAARQKHHARIVHAAPVAIRPVGPPWAGPNQCFTDEGYGRYSPCDGRGNR